MPHPFDATLKDILGHHAADLAPLLQLPLHLPWRPLNVDLSTISAATDLAFGFGEPLEQIVDIDFQSGPDSGLSRRLLLYNAAYHHHEGVPVRTIVLLLRPAADHPTLTGRLTYQAGASRVEFHYEAVRLWQQPVELFLGGGLGLLPLAPLCRLPAEQALRAVIHQIDQRLAGGTPHAEAVQLMTAAFVLTGLRVGPDTLAELFRGVKIMHESSAFTLYEEKGRREGRIEGRQKGRQEGQQEGRVEESHRMLLRLGTRKFGASDPATETALRAVLDLDRLERLAEAMLTANSWQELLATS